MKTIQARYLKYDDLLWLDHVISINQPRAIQAGGSRQLHLLPQVHVRKKVLANRRN